MKRVFGERGTGLEPAVTYLGSNPVRALWQIFRFSPLLILFSHFLFLSKTALVIVSNHRGATRTCTSRMLPNGPPEVVGDHWPLRERSSPAEQPVGRAICT